ncbi:hypothetical protein DSBG_1623 [Desulfosporosinus sp. BG]|nr:hypothetical protein DSBG_1623 [Desulfosporosinus sp. BG]
MNTCFYVNSKHNNESIFDPYLFDSLAWIRLTQGVVQSVKTQI